MTYFGTIRAVRDHPIAPLKVEIDLGEGLLEDWLMVSLEAWASVKQSDLVDGVQVGVIRSPIVSDPWPFRVVHIFPGGNGGNLLLPDNRKALAREGHPVGIKGVVNLTPAAAPTILAGVPPVSPLSHNLTGRLIEND